MTCARPVPLTAGTNDLELHAFVIEAWTGTPSNFAPEEHDALAWFRPEDLSGLRLAHPALGDLVAEVASGA